MSNQLFMLEQPDAEWAKVDNLLCSRAEAKILSKFLAHHRIRLLEAAAMQHNSVDRVGGATVEGALFYKEEVFFAPGAGLWAVLRADSGDVEKLIAPALRVLTDTGFGADRSTGRGFFDIHIEPLGIELFQQKQQAVMTLSRYLPQEGEINLNDEPLAYRLSVVHPKREQRLGYGLERDSRPVIYKRAVRMFEPGSVFPYPVSEKDIFGRWALLSSPKSPPIYQSGAAVMLPL
jgi:CRISPR type III-A-associated RAMP protein Csm4